MGYDVIMEERLHTREGLPRWGWDAGHFASPDPILGSRSLVNRAAGKLSTTTRSAPNEKGANPTGLGQGEVRIFGWLCGMMINEAGPGQAG